MSNHTSGSDNDIVPYGYPGKDLNPGTKPDVTTNCNRFIEHKPSVALISEQGMAGGVEAATGTDHNMIPEFDLSTIQDSHTVIGEEILPDLDIIPIVAPEWGIDVDPLSYLPEEF